MNKVIVKSPSTMANISVGFDILGLCLSNLSDEITLKRIEKGIKISVENNSDIPTEVSKNTAGVAVQAFLKEQKISHGFEIKIKKGIPLCSGLGGSASSAVGAVVAANQFLEKPLPKKELLSYALDGEFIASQSYHADNVAPCLLGGMQIHSREINEILNVPFPENLSILIIHPDEQVPTEKARSILKKDYQLNEFIEQSMNLSSFLIACFTNNENLLQKSIKDVLIEPQRSKLISCFPDVKNILKNKNLPLGISGAGPTMFSISNNFHLLEQIKGELSESLSGARIYIDSINLDGAKITHES